MAAHRPLATRQLDFEPCGVDIRNVWMGVDDRVIDVITGEVQVRMLYVWPNDAKDVMEDHWGEGHDNDGKKGYWDDYYEEQADQNSKLFDRLPNGSIVHIEQLNSKYADLFDVHKLYFIFGGINQNSKWKYYIGDCETGDVIRIPASYGSGWFGNLSYVYGSAYAFSGPNPNFGGVLWGKRGSGRKGHTVDGKYVGHEPINMRMYDGHDSVEDKRYVRPIDIAEFKELWGDSSCPNTAGALGLFDFEVVGDYSEGNGSTNGNHWRCGPRVDDGGRRILQAGDRFVVPSDSIDLPGHLIDSATVSWDGHTVGLGHIRLQHSSGSIFDTTVWINEPDWANGYTKNSSGNFVKTARLDPQKATFNVTPTRVPMWFYSGRPSLTLAGVFNFAIGSGPSYTGAQAVELFATAYIADLGLYAVGVSNNGAADVSNYTLSGSIEGGRIWISRQGAADFKDMYGEDATITGQQWLTFDTNDSITLWYSGAVVDRYGVKDQNGAGQEWEYEKGVVIYRKNNTPPTPTFDSAGWVKHRCEKVASTFTITGRVGNYWVANTTLNIGDRFRATDAGGVSAIRGKEGPRHLPPHELQSRAQLHADRQVPVQSRTLQERRPALQPRANQQRDLVLLEAHHEPRASPLRRLGDQRHLHRYGQHSHTPTRRPSTRGGLSRQVRGGSEG